MPSKHDYHFSENDTGLTEVVDIPGADEEVCLLPDTEREISEADKAEAEKVLAEKRKQTEGILFSQKVMSLLYCYQN